MAALAGCGSDDSWDELEADGELDLDELEQPIISQGSPGEFTSGVHQLAPHGQCFHGSVLRCLLPKQREMSYCVDAPSFSAEDGTTVFNALATQLTAIQSLVNGFQRPVGVPTWSLTMAPLGTSCFARATQTVVANSALLRPRDNNMGNYQAFILTAFSQLTDSLPGTYSVIDRASVIIDLAAIQARGASSREDSILLGHALARGALAVLGVGNTAQASNFATSLDVAPIVEFAPMTTGQACRMARYRVNDTTSFSTTVDNLRCSND